MIVVGLKQFLLCIVSAPIVPDAEDTIDQFLVHDARLQMRIAMTTLSCLRERQRARGQGQMIRPLEEARGTVLDPIHCTAMNHGTSTAMAWIDSQLRDVARTTSGPGAPSTTEAQRQEAKRQGAFSVSRNHNNLGSFTRLEEIDRPMLGSMKQRQL